MTVRLLGAATCIFILGACSSADTPEVGGVCTPQETRECTCLGGAKGTQVCNSTGTTWGLCGSCQDHDAGVTPTEAGTKTEAGLPLDDGGTAQDNGGVLPDNGGVLPDNGAPQDGGADLGGCTPGTKRCSGNDVEQCNSAGTDWIYYRTCPAAEPCKGDGVCTPAVEGCGDGVINGNDECDDQDLGTATCLTQGFEGGTLACTAGCLFDTSSCYKCGDGVRNGTDQCDDQDLGTATCVSQGFASGTLACKVDCTFDTAACVSTSCGDGVINGTDQCDDQDFGAATCVTQGFESGALACTAGCSFDTSSCTRCGDGVRNGADQCDGADIGAATCVTQGFEGGELGCTAGCTLDTSACYKCGDGVINGTDQCDGNALGTATCATAGLSTGTLACNLNCTFNTSGCYASGELIDTSAIAVRTLAGSLQIMPAVAFDGANYLVVWQDGRSGDWDIYGRLVSAQGVVLSPVDIPISTAAGDQALPDVAFDGANYLVVWQDERNGSDAEVFGARVTPAGIVLDNTGAFSLYLTGGSVIRPTLAFDGTNYLLAVVSAETVNTNVVSSLHGIQITTAAQFASSALLIADSVVTHAELMPWPDLAYSNGRYLMVWNGNTGSDWDIFGARITPLGVVLDPGGFTVSDAAGDQWSPTVAGDGVNFFTLWSDRRNGGDLELFGAHVSGAGTVTLGVEYLSANTTGMELGLPSLAFDGTNYMVATNIYSFGSGNYTSNIFGYIMSTDGTYLSTETAIAPSSATDPTGGSQPRVAFGSASYLVTWDGNPSGDWNIYGARISP